MSTKQPCILTIECNHYLLPDDADAPRILKALSRSLRGYHNKTFRKGEVDQFEVTDRPRIQLEYPDANLVVVAAPVADEEIKEEFRNPRRLAGGPAIRALKPTKS